MERRLRICQHCDGEFPAASTGRPAKYCGATCRKRAHDQRKIDEAMARTLAAERRRSIVVTKLRPRPRIVVAKLPLLVSGLDAGSRRGLSMLPLWVEADDQVQPDA